MTRIKGFITDDGVTHLVPKSTPLTVEAITVHDPFMGVDVQISNRLVDRLRGRYASGPHLPNGNPEFGWRQFQALEAQAQTLMSLLRRVRGVRCPRRGYGAR